MYSTVYLMVFIVFAIILILNFFDIITLALSTYTVITAMYDVSISIIMFFSMFYYGAKTNELLM